MKKQITLLSILVLSTISLSSCNISQKTDSIQKKEITSEEKDKGLEVTASFYPIEFVLKEIWWEKINVTNISGNRWIHEYSPSPKDIAKMHNSDLVVFVWENLEPWIEDLEKNLEAKNVATLEIANEIELKKIEDKHHHEHEHKKEDHEDDNEEEHKDEHYEEEWHHHHHWDFDPHFWLSPVLMIEFAEKVEKKLENLDPNNAQTFQENLKLLKSKLENLDQKYKTQLVNCNNEEAIISHNAFGYLQDLYNFHLHPIAGISTTDEPSAKILAELKKEAEEWITHILVEKWNVEEFANTLANETWLETLQFNPMGKWVYEWEDYFSTMEDNLQKLKIALDCK